MPDADDAPRLRPFWSGTITFGLVSVPVNLYPATVSRRPSLRMVDEEGTPLNRRYFCPKHDKEISRDEIVRGFETDDGKMVVVTDDELESLAPEKTREIDLRRFVEEDELDPLFFQRAYLLAPAADSTKAYRLLAATMERSGRAGLATFVMRVKEYLVAILAEGGVLRAETMRFAHEVRTPDDVGLAEPPEADAKRVKAIRKAIRAGAEDELDESDLEDPYRERLADLVKKKLKAKKDVVTPPAEVREDADEEGGGQVIDLMEALRRSLAGGGEGEREPAKRAGPKKAAGRKGDDGLASRTKKELYEQAQELDIEGRSSMTKDELVKAIRSA